MEFNSSITFSHNSYSFTDTSLGLRISSVFNEVQDCLASLVILYSSFPFLLVLKFLSVNFCFFPFPSVQCLKCKNNSNTFDPLMDIMLDIKVRGKHLVERTDWTPYIKRSKHIMFIGLGRKNWTAGIKNLYDNSSCLPFSAVSLQLCQVSLLVYVLSLIVMFSFQACTICWESTSAICETGITRWGKPLYVSKVWLNLMLFSLCKNSFSF